MMGIWVWGSMWEYASRKLRNLPGFCGTILVLLLEARKNFIHTQG